MIRYHFDLYPRLTPVAGALVRRLVNLQQAEYRGEANGTGSGKIILRGNSADAAFLDPKGMQYIRVVRDDGATEVVVGGFFLENGDYEALTERSTKKLTFGGAGALSYLSRAIAAEETYIAGAEGPFDDTWHWYYSPAGSILWRMVTEALDPDRPQSPIAGVTLNFSQSLDSDGNAWPGYGTSWLFTAQVKEGLVPIMRRLLEAGLYVWMDPDTFELSAWMANAHGRDRTGLAWGTNVVRFQAPTDATIATGNIKSDAKRGIGALLKRSDLLVGSAEGTEWVNDPSADLVWEGGYQVDDPTGTSLSQIGAAQLDARNDAGDTVRLRMMLDSSPTTGKYLPFEHVQLDDRVTLHTGTGQWDWNETEQKVAAISLKLRSGSDWDAWVDLGSKYSSIEDRAFANTPVGAHTHPMNPRLCEDVLCANLTAGDLDALTTPNGDAEDTGGWSGAGYLTSAFYDGIRSYGLASSASSDFTYTFAPTRVFSAGIRYVLDVWHRSQGNTTTSTTSFGVDGGDEEIAASGTKIGEALGADGETWSHLRICWTPTADRIGVRYRQIQTYDATGTVALDDGQLYSAGVSVGTEPRAARCDHSHRHNDLPGRTEAETHPAASVSETTYGDVQAAIDALAAGSGSLLDWFIVTDPAYGAVGDGVADDTAAIQAAIDAAKDGGGVVYFPVGTYLISDTLDVQPSSSGGRSVLLLGSSTPDTSAVTDVGSVIVQDTADTTAIAAGTNLYDLYVRDLKIYSAAGFTAGYGISAARNIHCTNVYIIGFWRGYGLLGAGGAQSYYSKNVKLTVRDAEDAGIYLSSGVNNAEFIACRTSGCDVGLRSLGVQSLRVIGGAYEGAATYNIRVDSSVAGAGTTQPSRAVLIDGVYFEGGGMSDIGLGITASTVVENVTVSTCYFSPSGVAYITGQYVDGVVLNNNFYQGAKSKVSFTSPATNVTIIGPEGGTGAYGTLPAATIRLDLAGFNGSVISVMPVGSRPDEATSTFGTAGSGYACLVNIPGPMLLRSVIYRVSAAGSGTVEWGLFYCGDPAAMTKVAGGSGALNATGPVVIAATGAPVTIPAGSYILITRLPSANQPTLFRTIPSAGQKLAKSVASYTWDNTPDITTGFADAGTIPNLTVVGDLDGSTQW